MILDYPASKANHRAVYLRYPWVQIRYRKVGGRC